MESSIVNHLVHYFVYQEYTYKYSLGTRLANIIFKLLFFFSFILLPTLNTFFFKIHFMQTRGSVTFICVIPTKI